jgi:uncharacterized protein YjiS (DUF1127 family)
MSVAYQDSVVSTGFHPIQGLGAWITRRMAALAAARRRARELQDLAMFTDRDLWDVGLSRSDLMAIEKGIYRRD